MRKFLALLLGFAFAAAVGAQGHNMHCDQTQCEKGHKDTLTLSSHVKFGDVVVAPGEYQVMCQTKRVSLTRKSGQVRALDVECQGAMLPDKVARTVLQTSTDASGMKVADKLLLKGSHMEHVFK